MPISDLLKFLLSAEYLKFYLEFIVSTWLKFMSKMIFQNCFQSIGNLTFRHTWSCTFMLHRNGWLKWCFGLIFQTDWKPPFKLHFQDNLNNFLKLPEISNFLVWFSYTSHHPLLLYLNFLMPNHRTAMDDILTIFDNNAEQSPPSKPPTHRATTKKTDDIKKRRKGQGYRPSPIPQVCFESDWDSSGE